MNGDDIFMWIKLIGGVALVVGLFLIFESRKLVKLSSNVQNENISVFQIKRMGIAIFILGGLICINQF